MCNDIIGKNLKEVAVFSSVFFKLTDIPINKIHNNFNENINIFVKNNGEIVYMVCDGFKILGYNYSEDKFKYSKHLTEGFILKVEGMISKYTENVLESFFYDIKNINIYTTDFLSHNERKLISKYKNDFIKEENSERKFMNSYNQWKNESIPKIEYKENKEEYIEIIKLDNEVEDKFKEIPSFNFQELPEPKRKNIFNSFIGFFF